MGDIADMMLDGDLCQGCGEFMDGEGYAQFCKGCQKEMGIDRYGEPLSKKIPCPICGKKVKQTGLAMHKRDVHKTD